MSSVHIGPAGHDLAMLRDHLDEIPSHDLPAGFRLRPMETDDIPAWTALQRATEKHFDIPTTLFRREFGHDDGLIRERCRLLCSDDATVIGCISAWFDEAYRGRPYGRIHWVAIHPDHQGRGLAKPMLSEAMRLLAGWHERAYLRTQSKRLPAINLYLHFGFRPQLDTPGERRAWESLREALPTLRPHLD